MTKAKKENSHSPSCPLCGSCDGSKVSHTTRRFEHFGNTRSLVIRRRRICAACDLPYYTVEKTEPAQLSPNDLATLPRKLET